MRITRVSSFVRFKYCISDCYRMLLILLYTSACEYYFLITSLIILHRQEQIVKLFPLSSRFPGTTVEVAQKLCYKCKKVGHLSRDCTEDTSVSNSNGGHAGSRDTPEMDRVTMEEDDINEIGDEEKEKLNDVDYLTGNPLPTDILLYAVPVCGPYNALQSYKYRVKIIPGTTKKGKGTRFLL